MELIPEQLEAVSLHDLDQFLSPKGPLVHGTNLSIYSREFIQSRLINLNALLPCLHSMT